MARAYRNEEGEIVISYAGTTGENLLDWLTGNVPAATAAYFPKQLLEAAQFHLDVRNAAPSAATIIFTGHSLGGGPASLVAVLRGRMRVLKRNFVQRFICMVMMLLGVTSCGTGIDEPQWTEELRLHDGRMIEIWHSAKRHAFGFPDRRGSLIEGEVEYRPLKVHWKGSGLLQPVSFEIFNGIPHLVILLVDPRDCGPLKRTGDYAAQFLRWQNGSWIEVPQAEFPVQQSLMNIYMNYWGYSSKSDPRGLITWEKKAEEDRFYADRPETVQHYFERRRYYCTER